MKIVDILKAKNAKCVDEFYSVTFGKVYLREFNEHFIKIANKNDDIQLLSANGKLYSDGETLLFPSKDNKDWMKYLIDFNDCDIIYIKVDSNIEFISIYNSYTNDKIFTYCDLSSSNNFYCSVPNVVSDIDSIVEIRKATDDEIKRLNDYFNSRNYSFDFDNKKLIVLDKYNINNFKPFDKVLCRFTKNGKWTATLFSYYNNDAMEYPFVAINDENYSQCIPYKNNEHLLGTINDCNEFYKNW